MTLPVVLRDEARDEFQEAFLFYEDQRAGLGDEFAANVQAVFDEIASHPERHMVVLEDIRKATVRKFPYRVFFRADQHRIEVTAVFHTSIDPNIWQART